VILFDGTQFIAVGDGGIVLSSEDGHSWQSNAISGTTGFSAIATGVLEGTPKYIAVSRDGSIYGADDFKNLLLKTTLTATLNSIVLGAAEAVAVGDTGKVGFSSNGKDWQTVDIAPAANLNGGFFTRGQFYALGSSGLSLSRQTVKRG